MKRVLMICSILVLASTFLFAQSTNEKVETVNLAVMQGPTGFSSVGLDDFVNVSVYASPDEAVAKLVNGELDMAVLPANTAAVLFNKGVDIKFAAIVGEGMLSVIGTDENSKTIAVPGLGGTPDHMQRLLYSQYEADYSVTAPAQLAQLLIAGKVKLAILPQPFVNMVLTKNDKCKVIGNVQEAWTAKTGNAGYPMSVLVVSSSFAKENKKVVNEVKNSYKNSIEWVLANTEEAGKKIEKVGIMKAAMATGALDKCALKFIDGIKAQNELLSYYRILLELEPKAIGNKIPDNAFWSL